MTIQELEKIMQEHGLVIRALPKKKRQVLEAGYKADYPDGTVTYMEEYKREMLVREQDLAPHLAGKFLIQSVKGTSADVHFEHELFDSIEDAVASVLKEHGTAEERISCHLEQIQKNKKSVYMRLRNVPVTVMPIYGNRFLILLDLSSDRDGKIRKCLLDTGASFGGVSLNPWSKEDIAIATVTWDTMLHGLMLPGLLAFEKGK